MKLEPKLISKYFRISFARSSGKGGQHVNTTDSKAMIKLTPNDWIISRGVWIKDESWDVIMGNFKDNVNGKRFPYFTPKMGVLVSSDSSRVRNDNLSECFDRFCNEIEKCSKPREEISEETKRRWKELEKRDNNKRLNDKKRVSDKKKSRKVNLD